MFLLTPLDNLVYIAASNMSAVSSAMALTEEEEYLLERFKILREKKRALQKLKEKVETKVKPAIKREAQETLYTPEDAKRKAEMLVAAGRVKIAKTTAEREFKRARLPEKKAKEPLSDQETSISEEQRQANRNAMKEMYNSRFVKGGRNEDNADSGYQYRGYREHRKGKTIFVKGYELTEEIIKTAFDKFGTVVDSQFEKNGRSIRHGFVTFKTCEAAEKAIEEMNGTQVSGVNIEVSYARKQIHHSEGSRGNQAMWPSRDFRSQEHHKQMPESRKLQSYNKDDDFF